MKFLLTISVLVASVGQVQAGLIFNVLESEGDINVTLSGSVDLNALHGFQYLSFSGVVYAPGIGIIQLGDIGFTDIYKTNPTPINWGWTQYGSGGVPPPDEHPGSGEWDTSSGSAVSLHSDAKLGLPTGYVSGSSLSGTATKFGETFASLSTMKRPPHPAKP